MAESGATSKKPPRAKRQLPRLGFSLRALLPLAAATVLLLGGAFLAWQAWLVWLTERAVAEAVELRPRIVAAVASFKG